MTAARGVALLALVAVIAVVAVVLLRDGNSHDVPPALPERRPARQGRRRPGRRAPRRLDPRHLADRRQPGRDRDRGRRRLRAAARGDDGDDPRDVAVGHRQPLHRADARRQQPPAAAVGRAARDRLDDLDRRPRPALQHARPGDAQGRCSSSSRATRAGTSGAGAGQRGGEVPRPGAVVLARARRRGRPRPGHVRRLPADLVADRRRARRAPRRPREPRRATRTPPRRRSATRTRRWPAGARPAAGHAAQGEHDVREPPRDARRPRRARRGVEARDEATSRRSSPSCARSCATRARRSPTCARSIRRPGAGNDLIDLLRRAPRLEQVARPALRNSTQALKDSTPVLQLRPPVQRRPRRLAARLRPGRLELRRQRPLRPHPADLQRLLVRRQPGGRHAHADRAEPAPRRPADRVRPPLPGRRVAAAPRTARRRGATRAAPSTATRRSRSPAREARPRHRHDPARGERARRVRDRRDDAAAPHLQGARDLRERVLGHPGRGREGRRASRSARSTRST